MTHLLHGRHLLREIDFTPAEWMPLIDLAAELKAEKKEGREVPHPKGRNTALVFEKASTRTRCSFKIVIVDQGAHMMFLDPAVSQIGHKESVADTVGVLGHLFDGIEYRDGEQVKVDTLTESSDVPVWNGLTDNRHPTQTLYDVLTTRKHVGKLLSEMSYVYVGGARFNMGRSLLVNGALIGADVRIVVPEQLWPDEEYIANMKKITTETDACITLTGSVNEGAVGVGFVHTGIWVSVGEPKGVWDERIALLSTYQVNAGLVTKAMPNAKLMHCLPTFHDRNTAIDERIFQATGLGKLEVANEVFEGSASTTLDQVENRMYTIKAVMVATLGD